MNQEATLKNRHGGTHLVHIGGAPSGLFPPSRVAHRVYTQISETVVGFPIDQCRDWDGQSGGLCVRREGPGLSILTKCQLYEYSITG